MRAHAPWIIALALLGLSCSAGGGPIGGNRDAGGGGGGFDAGGGGGGVDAGPRSDGGGTLPFDGGPLTDGGCGATTPLDTTIIGDPPDMLIVMDISGSMCSPLFDSFPPSGMTKMSIMKDALQGLTTSKDGRINFGLMTFPGSSGACAAGTVRNPIAARNAASINATLGAIPEGMFDCVFANTGATPTAPSLDAARSYYGSIAVNPVGRYVLLATDGLPNCGPTIPDSGGATEETVDETVTAIEALNSAGIQTYVIGFGTGFGGDPTALNRMATAGGTGSPYNASSAAALDMALDTIAAEIIPPSCVVEVGGAARDPSLFQVRFDGGPLIPRNMAHTSGWDYDSATRTITFYGSECTAVQNGTVTSIDVDFGCPGPLI